MFLIYRLCIQFEINLLIFNFEYLIESEYLIKYLV